MSRHALEIADIFRAHGPAIGHRSLPDARWERNFTWWGSVSPSRPNDGFGSAAYEPLRHNRYMTDSEASRATISWM